MNEPFNFEAEWLEFAAQAVDPRNSEQNLATARSLFYWGGVKALQRMLVILRTQPTPDAYQALDALIRDLTEFLKAHPAAPSH